MDDIKKERLVHIRPSISQENAAAVQVRQHGVRCSNRLHDCVDRVDALPPSKSSGKQIRDVQSQPENLHCRSFLQQVPCLCHCPAMTRAPRSTEKREKNSG
jgi:hypothetical protein